MKFIFWLDYTKSKSYNKNVDLYETDDYNDVTGANSGYDADNKNYRIVCFYSNWAYNRNGEGKFLPKDIDPYLCTHIIYLSAHLENFKLSRHDNKPPNNNNRKQPGHNNERLTDIPYKKITNLKNSNKKLKVLLSVGGKILDFAMKTFRV